MRGIRQGPDFIANPCGAAQRMKLGLDHAIRVDEVAHVVDGVFDLLGRERAARPIGERLGFGKRDIAKRMHEIVVRALRALAEEPGGDLCVEDRRRAVRRARG